MNEKDDFKLIQIEGKDLRGEKNYIRPPDGIYLNICEGVSGGRILSPAEGS